ncbi:MAG TPA: hypothetical protein VG222_05905, partial [Vicinamibacterales bacterium]|nr:hypothetical protein [Vicinamibacterales bacterium]
MMRWAVDGLDAMTWRGIGISGAIVPGAVLLGFAAVFAALALTRRTPRSTRSRCSTTARRSASRVTVRDVFGAGRGAGAGVLS